MKARGFTIIELLVVIVILVAVAFVAWTQIQTLQSMHRDDTRRTAINAMYYNLEDVFYAQNKYYPPAIDEDALTAMDSSLFTDPNGIAIGDANSDYKYLPTNCNAQRCSGYTLRADMERESDYVKSSRRDG